MTRQKIEAHRVTKPIQLLAAWLIGLVLVDGIFLGAAMSLGDAWERSLLVIAAVLNVPGFLLAIFLLQTKFRPELQEDAFYYEYISKKTSSTLEISKVDLLEKTISELQIEIERRSDTDNNAERLLAAPGAGWNIWKVALNAQLPFFDGLKAELNQAGIPVFAIFGKNASAPLKDYNVSISHEIDTNHVLMLLKIIAKFPVTSFDFWYPIREAEENEDVYIGSFGSEENAVAMTASVRSAIAAAQDRADLIKIRGF